MFGRPLRAGRMNARFPGRRAAPGSGAPPLPTWVPAVGDAETYTVGGGVLTNNWRAIHDPNGLGYNAFYSVKITDYSAMFLHSAWRSYGGMVLWGGGHSATNYNGVTMLTFDASTMYFECVQAPHDWIAALDIGDASAEFDTTFGEVTGSSPLKLAPPHSYGVPSMVGNTLVQTFGASLAAIGTNSVQAAHNLDLSDPATSYNSRAWVRRTSTAGDWSPALIPMMARYVPVQDKIIIMCRGGGSPYSMQWFDLATNDYVTGSSNTGWTYTEGSIAGGALLYVPARDILVGMWPPSGGGNVVVEYANVASGATPSRTGAATLSASLSVPSNWGAACWCEDSNRILVFGVTGNTDKVYEIELPTTLSNTWTVTSHTLPGGKTIVPFGGSEWGKSADYNPRTKCCTFLPSGLSSGGNDSVLVYRPRNT